MVTTASLLIAKLFGVAYLAIGIAGLVDKKLYLRVMKDTFSNSGVLLLYGFFALIGGVLMLHFHNIWEASWVVVLTIFGWLSLFKGFSILIAPKKLLKTSQGIFKSSVGRYTAHLCIVLGILFFYFIYFA